MSVPEALVFEVTDADFEHKVLDASRDRPVLVDFWADWCQPCKMLMPVLARVVEQLAGQVLLAKVNTDGEQQLAMRMGIRSLPTVRLYRNGEAVGEFMGVQTEQAIRQFLAPHLAAPANDSRAAAHAAFERNDLEEAERLLRDALAESPEAAPLRIDLATVLLATGRVDDAESTLDGVPAEAPEDNEVRRLRQQARFIRQTLGIADVTALEARLKETSADDETLHDGAALRVAQGHYEEALGLLLRLLGRARAFRDDAARRDMLAVFEILGSESPLVREYRRKMASALF